MKTFRDIEELSLNDATIHHIRTLFKLGQLSKEDTLIHMVCALAEEKKNLTERLIDAEQKKAPEY